MLQRKFQELEKSTISSFDILQPVALAGSLSGGQILSTSSVKKGLGYMSRRFAAPKQENYTDGMCVLKEPQSRRANEDSHCCGITFFLPLAGKHIRLKWPPRLAGGAGLGGEACDNLS